MKNVKFATVGTLLISTILLGSVVASAAPGASEGVDANRITDGIITFIENDEPTSPVDPTDPGTPVNPINPIDPNKPIEPGTEGPLSLDYASSFNFGKQKITSQDETYYAAHQVVTIDGKEKDVPLYGQVTDNRGDYKGWTLGIKQNGQFKTTGTNSHELEGARIQFLNGVVAKDETGNAEKPGLVNPTVTIDPDGKTTQTLVTAAANQGQGTWVYRLGDLTTMDESVALEVPGASTKKKESYETTLTWVLSTTPGEDPGEEPGEPGEEPDGNN